MESDRWANGRGGERTYKGCRGKLGVRPKRAFTEAAASGTLYAVQGSIGDALTAKWLSANPAYPIVRRFAPIFLKFRTYSLTFLRLISSENNARRSARKYFCF